MSCRRRRGSTGRDPMTVVRPFSICSGDWHARNAMARKSHWSRRPIRFVKTHAMATALAPQASHNVRLGWKSGHAKALDPRKMMGKDGAILGMTMFNATPEDHRMAHAALVAGLENGTLSPVIGREMPFAQVVESHAAVMEPGAYGKIMLVP